MGKTNMTFIDPGANANSSYHFLFVLEKGLLPDIQARYRQHKWRFQQDGAPAHTVHNTTVYLKKENIDFIEPDVAPNIPDLKLVDYAVWGALQKNGYHG